ncbi:fh [Drosophila busckii]|uniref:ferroxidase n=1 Tax=Drosophila busckii TaxID=30019 RepID=A0A0M3QZC8_DROBS|nr:fh [Drosophila busckii]
MNRSIEQGIFMTSKYIRNYKQFGTPFWHAETTTGINIPKVHTEQTTKAYSSQAETDCSLDNATYERVCAETLDALSDYFDELMEQTNDLPGSDVAYGDGVLTIKLGSAHGTYVINRQTPNKQIWLSSPSSGPKRFDFVTSSGDNNGKWIYKHSGESLHELLQLEIGNILKNQTVNFKQLPY